MPDFNSSQSHYLKPFIIIPFGIHPFTLFYKVANHLRNNEAFTCLNNITERKQYVTAKIN